ncbi:hypothetical protein ACFW95_05500 [Streptomyces sp. NPDC059474]|uniref:hypothetical protein n=1 Tax=Streptomyces sp. NPDC059474 TaxID=3346846 RepID=UPI00367C268A
MGQFGEFFGSDAGVPQGLDDGPGPEGVVLDDALVDAPPGAADFLDVDVRRTVVEAAAHLVDRGQHPQVVPSGMLEDLVERGAPGRVQQRGGFTAYSFRGLDEDRQVRQPFPNPLVHPRGGLLDHLVVAGAVAPGDRAGDGPLGPEQLLVCPFLDVKVEAADAHHHVDAGASFADLTALVGVGHQALLPAVDDVVGDPEGVNAGVVGFDVRPEDAGQFAYQSTEGAVVDAGPAFFEVAHQHVADLSGLDVVGVDQFGGRPLSVPERVLERVLGLEDADPAQQVPGAVGADVCFPARAPVAGAEVEDVLRGELVEVTASVQDDRRDQAQALVDVAARHADVGAVAAHLLQLAVGEELLDVLEEAHGFVAAQEAVARQDDPVDHQLVHARDHAVALGVALVVAQDSGVHDLLALVGAGRAPPGLPAVSGVGLQPVQDPAGEGQEPDAGIDA